jgi:hypothetical protein
MVCLVVTKFSDIAEKIIPFFDKHPVQGIKSRDYQDFKRVVELMKVKAHLTIEGLAQIRDIKAGMNTGRDYIELHSNSDKPAREDSQSEEDKPLPDKPPEDEPSTAVKLPKYQVKHNPPRKGSFIWCSNKLKPAERIGPHDLDVISLIVGSLLGNTYLEKRKTGLAIRIIFVKCNNNVEFLMWFHLFLAKRGYCNLNKPKLSKIITKGNKVLFSYCISSYSFSSLN